ncbi:MAG: hypothetical protein IJY11_01855 [Clostridia bacterium]|nr:hypothetical protein [Clostridia bacterium]
MEIDVISFTDDQYARLTDEQLIEVKEVQLKKNKLTRALEEAKAKEKFRMLKNGVFLGSSYEKVCEQLQSVYDEEVSNLRDGLLFYLRFAVRTETGEEAPYLVDYSLSYSERIAIVREYYETTYTDAKERVAAFEKDAVALSYLGESYAPLYELYYEQAYL